MKKYTIMAAAAVLAALAVCGCAKVKSTGLNDANKLYFDSWIHIHYPYLRPTALGSYIIEMKDGTGPLISDSAYVRMYYTITGLDGTGVSTNDSTLAKQWGSFDPTYYFGPAITYRADSSLYAGLDELMLGKHVGLHFKAIIPGWLLSTNRYDSADGYLANESGDNAIYDVTVYDNFNNVKRWELDSLFKYMIHNYPEISLADTLDYKTSSTDSANFEAFYYVQTEPSDHPDSLYSEDATIYINYIGRLLDGTVFDTNIADTAKVYGIYSSSTTYEPSQINWGSSYDDLTMGSSKNSVITGFKLGIYQMHPHEKATLVFYSKYGYDYSGSGYTIPPYAQLRFDIEVVDN